jgi:hypothetical protein
MKQRIWVILGLGMVWATAGCNVCEDLDARMCTDLGAEDCAVWKEAGMNFEAQASGREGRKGWLKKLFFGSNSAVCNSSNDDSVYPTILSSTKQAVAGLRKAKAAGMNIGQRADE